MTPPALIVLFCAAAAAAPVGAPPPNTVSPEESFAEALPPEPQLDAETKSDQTAILSLMGALSAAPGGLMLLRNMLKQELQRDTTFRKMLEQVSQAAGGSGALMRNPVWSALFSGEGIEPGAKLDSLGLEPPATETQQLLLQRAASGPPAQEPGDGGTDVEADEAAPAGRPPALRDVQAQQIMRNMLGTR